MAEELERLPTFCVKPTTSPGEVVPVVTLKGLPSNYTFSDIKVRTGEVYGIDPDDYHYTSCMVGVNPLDDDTAELKVFAALVAKEMDDACVFVYSAQGKGTLVPLSSFETLDDLAQQFQVEPSIGGLGVSVFMVRGKPLDLKQTKDELGLVHGSSLFAMLQLRGG